MSLRDCLWLQRPPRLPSAHDLEVMTQDPGLFERAVAEMEYSAAMAEIFEGIGPEQTRGAGGGPVSFGGGGYNPNHSAQASKRRPHSAAGSLPSYAHASVSNGSSSVVSTNGLPLAVQLRPGSGGSPAPSAIVPPSAYNLSNFSEANFRNEAPVRFGIILGAFWYHFGHILGAFWAHFAGHFLSVLLSFGQCGCTERESDDGRAWIVGR